MAKILDKLCECPQDPTVDPKRRGGILSVGGPLSTAELEKKFGGVQPFRKVEFVLDPNWKDRPYDTDTD